MRHPGASKPMHNRPNLDAKAPSKKSGAPKTFGDNIAFEELP
jgi:hypothetical protein